MDRTDPLDDSLVIVDAPAATLRAASGVGPEAIAPELAEPRAPAPAGGGGGWPFRGFGMPQLPWRQGRTVLDRPDVCITVASSFPDRLRLLKRVNLFPISLTLRADYVRATRSFECGCSARDAVLGGDVRLDAGGKSLTYFKRLPLGASGAHVAVLGGVSLGGAMRGDFSQASLKPTLSFRYELGGGGAVWSGERVDLRHRVALTRRLGLEARGSARLPAPRAELTLGGRRTRSGRLADGGGGGGRVSLGDGGPLCLHVEEVNAILWL